MTARDDDATRRYDDATMTLLGLKAGQLRDVLKAFIFGTPEVFVGSAASKFDKETLALTDQATKDAVKAQLAAFAKFIKRIKASA